MKGYEFLGRGSELFLFAVFGLVIGSFLNVCIYRIPRGISVVSGNRGRSMCVHCGHDLGGLDMIPLISYLFLKGKCRYCKNPISARYPLVEALNSLLWLSAGIRFGLSAAAACYCIFFSILIVLSMIDWEFQEIPYRLQAAVAVLALVSLAIPGFAGIKERLIGMLIISVPMAIGALVNAFGGGDVQLMFVSGFLLGWKCMIVAMFVAVLVGAVHAVIALGRKKRGLRMPFGPYLSIGMVISVFWGNSLVNWYMGFF